MPYLATTRAGVKEFLEHAGGSRCIWIGCDVLSEDEIALLRELGHSISVFVHEVESADDIADAIATLEEHLPNEAVWVEAKPEKANPRSIDIGQAFLWHEWIANVSLRHDDLVEVTNGVHKGLRGSLVSLIALKPEPTYIVEIESGFDLEVGQSWLRSVGIAL